MWLGEPVAGIYLDLEKVSDRLFLAGENIYSCIGRQPLEIIDKEVGVE